MKQKLEPKIIFKTARLVVRAACLSDAPMFFALWTDPAVMGNVGFPGGLRITLQEIEEKIREQKKPPFECLLVVELKAGGVAIGECRMYLPDEKNISETDVKLLTGYWGHKYGVEIKRGLLDYLFANTDCTAVRATPIVNNFASIKMQEAVGGERVGEATLCAKFLPHFRDAAYNRRPLPLQKPGHLAVGIQQKVLPLCADGDGMDACQQPRHPFSPSFRLFGPENRPARHECSDDRRGSKQRSICIQPDSFRNRQPGILQPV